MDSITKLTHATVLVDDQNEALDFYVGTIGFEKRADEQMGNRNRGVSFDRLRSTLRS